MWGNASEHAYSFLYIYKLKIYKSYTWLWDYEKYELLL